MGGAIWGVLGSLVGVVVGAWLTARWQRKQWILDNKRAEYRGILDASHDYYWQAINYLKGRATVPGGALGTVHDPASLAQALHVMWSKLTDRIFVSDALVESGLHQEMQNLHRSLTSNPPPDAETWGKNWYEFHGELRKTVWRDLKVRERIPPSTDGPDESLHGDPHGKESQGSH